MTDPLTCKSCPSYLSPEQVPNKYGRSPGVPMCGRFGYILATPGMDSQAQDRVRTQYASKCEEYGNPMPPTPGRKHTIMLPDPQFMERITSGTDPIDPDKQSACSSCMMCRNFVTEATVSSELGFTGVGLCSAKGKLLFSNRFAAEATNCEYREFGSVRSSIGGMQFLPELDPNFGKRNIIAEALSGKFIEPGEYPTDKEVSEGERSAGIRAWRAFEDPEGFGQPVYFPVYDSSFFDDVQRELIPKTGSDEHPELYIDHFGGMYGLGVAWMELDETPVFWGEPGVGKTELLRHAAWIMQLPFRRVSITASTDIDDIAGKMRFSQEKGTYFEYGRLPDAWGQPGVLCIDEPNVAEDPAVWHFIRPLTDNSKQLVLDMNSHETITRHPDCYMGMAMNPAWDTRNVGALEIADADANRLFHTYIGLPPEELEREIIRKRVELDGWSISTTQLDMVMRIAQDLRDLSDERALPITWAIRQQIKVARALKWFAPPTAYKRAAGDYLSPDAQQILLDQVRAHWDGN